VDVVDPSPPLKQLMHEADQLSVFSAEVAVVTVLGSNVFMVYRGTALPFTLVLEE
jgi:hypothetical protein